MRKYIKTLINYLINPSTTYYAHGKLLITGEYLVLDGALALAVPTKKGQFLKISPIKEPKVFWNSFDDENKIWFKRAFTLPVTPRKSDTKTVETLKNIFLKAQSQNPHFLNGKNGFKVDTFLEFPRNWGLGSSSTLLHNIAKWAAVNPYQLLRETMGGSGYDLACADSSTPIFYQLKNQNPHVTPVQFNPAFANQLYFIHLNQKQRSNKEINRYKSIQVSAKKEIVQLISDITLLMPQVTHLEDFEILLKEHEKLMSEILKKPSIQNHFRDYFGQLKSLGAWGGDFILATGNEDTPAYFKKKGYETVVSYKDMVL